jgi:hypothetical protein
MPGMPSGLSSSSTLAQIKACYDDNSIYYELQNTSYALAFVSACIMLLRRIPTHSRSGGGAEVDLDPELIKKQLKDAQDFLAANGIYPGSGVQRDINTSLEFLR